MKREPESERRSGGLLTLIALYHFCGEGLGSSCSAGK